MNDPLRRHAMESHPPDINGWWTKVAHIQNRSQIRVNFGDEFSRSVPPRWATLAQIRPASVARPMSTDFAPRS